MAKAVKRNFSGSLGLGNVKFDKSGFVSDGLSAVNQAAAGLSQSLQNESRQRNELEQNYRDGIVQGKFAPDMAKDVQAGLDELSKFGNSNSNEYKTKLNQLNAKLAIDVADQQRVHTAVTNQQAVAKNDPDAKFYEQDNIYNAINSSTDAKGLKTSDDDVIGAYKSAIKDVKNIKTDAVVEDFKEKIGSYVQQWNSETREIDINTGLVKETDQSGQTKRTQGFKIVNGTSVPKFISNSDIPVSWVEKFYGTGKANMALMDDYVEKNKDKYKDDPKTKNIDEGVLQLKQEFLREKILGTMIPDYTSISKGSEGFSTPPGGSGSGSSTENPTISLLGQAIAGSKKIIEGADLTTINVETSEDPVNVYNITDRFTEINFATDDEDGVKAKNVYLTTSKTDGEHTMYVDVNGKLKPYKESQFKQLVNDVGLSKNSGFNVDDLQKSKYYDAETQEWNLSGLLGKDIEIADDISDDEIATRNFKSTMTSVNSQLKSMGITLDNFAQSDISNKVKSEKVTEALAASLVGKKIPRLGQGIEIVSVSSENNNNFFGYDGRIRIEYVNGDSDKLTPEQFRERLTAQ